MTNIFLENAEILHNMWRRIKGDRSAWKPKENIPHAELCRQFHASFDSLAFPGGLEKELSELKEHDPEAIELAIQFLEADPWFFWSGYIKEEITHRLKRAHLMKSPLLSELQISRLHKVILDMILQRGRLGRELRYYCKLAWAIQTPELIGEVTQLITKSSDPIISSRANFALEIISSRASQ